MINALRVFLPWGNLVFDQQQFYPNDESKGWDGTFQRQADVAWGLYLLCRNTFGGWAY